MKRLILITMLFLTSCQPQANDVNSRSGYGQYTIEYLRERAYGYGEIEVVKMLDDQPNLTRYLFRYPSDDLTIYGYVNVPKGSGPHPILIALHGYVLKETYQGEEYDTDAMDRIAQEGYIVFHPFLRNYPPSDEGDNYFRVGMSIDVLNLIALVKMGNAPDELLSSAASDRIGLWGYSLGGGIVLRVLAVSPDIDAAVLYSSLSGDEIKNAELLWQLSSDPTLQSELQDPPGNPDQISPKNFYQYINAPIQLYHGTADTIVPLAWAEETCETLSSADVNISCKYFPDEGHSFRRRVSEEFYGSMLDFYKKYLSP